MIFECFDSRDGDIRVVRREVGPMFFGWLIDWSGNNLEILRILVGHQKEAITMMLDMVDQLFLPRLDQDGRFLRAVSMNKSDLRSQFTFDFEKNELPATRLCDRKLKTFIRFLYDGRVRVDVTPEHVAHCFVRALGGIEYIVKKGTAVRRPGK